jgi:hypothetical protein
LAVITSHLLSLRDNYQILTKLIIKINKAQDVRIEKNYRDMKRIKILIFFG